MKLTRILLRALILIMPGILLLFQGQCSYGEDDENCYQAPDGCITSKPDKGLVILHIDLQKSLDPVKIEIFSGTVEGGVLLSSFIASKNEDTLWMHNGDIAARAVYKTLVKGEVVTVNAIDGDRLEALSKDYCDGVTCYSKGSIALDLRLDETLIGKSP